MKLFCCLHLTRNRNYLVLILLFATFGALLVLLKVSRDVEKFAIHSKHDELLFQSYSSEGSSRPVDASRLYNEQDYWDFEEANNDHDRLTDSWCIVLVWTYSQKMAHQNWPTEGTTLKGNCTITYYHRYLQQADVVVFHQVQAAEGILPWRLFRYKNYYFIASKFNFLLHYRDVTIIYSEVTLSYIL